MFTDFDGSTSYEDEDWYRDRAECGAEYDTGGFDPYATHCIRKPGHIYGKDSTPHAGPHPLAEGPDGQQVIIMWRGGGTIAGDRVPYSDVQSYGLAVQGEPPVPDTWAQELADRDAREKEYALRYPDCDGEECDGHEAGETQEGEAQFWARQPHIPDGYRY